MAKITLNVEKMFCEECSLALRRFIGNMEGIESIDIEEGKVAGAESAFALSRSPKLIASSISPARPPESAMSPFVRPTSASRSMRGL